MEKQSQEIKENEDLANLRLKQVCTEAERSLALFEEHFSKPVKPRLQGRSLIGHPRSSAFSPRPPATRRVRSPFIGDKGDSSPHSHQHAPINTTYIPEPVLTEEEEPSRLELRDGSEGEGEEMRGRLAVLEAKESAFSAIQGWKEEQERIHSFL